MDQHKEFIQVLTGYTSSINKILCCVDKKVCLYLNHFKRKNATNGAALKKINFIMNNCYKKKNTEKQFP